MIGWLKDPPSFAVALGVPDRVLRGRSWNNNNNNLRAANRNRNNPDNRNNNVGFRCSLPILLKRAGICIVVIFK